MTPEEFARRMRELVRRENGRGKDYESPDALHSQADDLLCEVLRAVGYGDGVDEYLKLGRYFA